MKKITALVLSFGFIICFSRCSHTPKQDPNQSNPDSLKKVIIALNEEIFRSMNNLEKFQSYYEDSIVAAMSSGEIQTSSKALSHGLLRNYILPHDYTFRLFGNTAVLSYLYTNFELVGNDTTFHSLRGLKAFAYNNGKWKVVGGAGVEIPVNYFKPIVDKHEKDYASYVGVYQYEPGNPDTVFIKDGKLYDRSGPNINWNFPVNENEYMIKGDLSRLSFGKDSNGVIAYYTITNPDGQQRKCPKIK
jgi:hypothetical protein